MNPHIPSPALRAKLCAINQVFIFENTYRVNQIWIIKLYASVSGMTISLKV